MKRPLRIAIADDEPDMRDYFTKILPLLGHRVVATASNGEELLEQCRITDLDLVITDLKMPQMDGIEVAEQLHREKPVAVILVSAYQDGWADRQAEPESVNAFLVKPIKRADLEPAISQALERRFGAQVP